MNIASVLGSSAHHVMVIIELLKKQNELARQARQLEKQRLSDLQQLRSSHLQLERGGETVRTNIDHLSFSSVCRLQIRIHQSRHSSAVVATATATPVPVRWTGGQTAGAAVF